MKMPEVRPRPECLIKLVLELGINRLPRGATPSLSEISRLSFVHTQIHKTPYQSDGESTFLLRGFMLHQPSSYGFNTVFQPSVETSFMARNIFDSYDVGHPPTASEFHWQ